MSDNQIDDLFGNKLHDYSGVPENDLWESIRRKTEKPKRKRGAILWGVAASVVLCLSLGGWFYLQTEPEQMLLAFKVPAPGESNMAKKSMIENNKEVENTEQALCALPHETKSTEKQYSLGKQKEADKVKKAPDAADHKGALIPKSTDFYSASAGEEPAKATPPIGKETESPSAIVNNNTKNNTPKEVPGQRKENTPDKSNGRTLIFDISEFDRAVATTTTTTNGGAPVDSTANEHRLKKLLRLAKDIKGGENGLAELRAAKNDLLGNIAALRSKF